MAILRKNMTADEVVMACEFSSELTQNEAVLLYHLKACIDDSFEVFSRESAIQALEDIECTLDYAISDLKDANHRICNRLKDLRQSQAESTLKYVELN